MFIFERKPARSEVDITSLKIFVGKKLKWVPIAPGTNKQKSAIPKLIY